MLRKPLLLPVAVLILTLLSANSMAATDSAPEAKASPPVVLSPQSFMKIEVPQSPSPGAASPSPSVSPSPVLKAIGKTNVMKLRNSFERALSDERLALAHRQKSEMRQLKASQRQSLREWMDRESSARQEFFEKTESGHAKAAWMKDRKARYHKLRQDQDAELSRVRAEQENTRKALGKEQEGRRVRFETAIKSGFLPADELWPAKGR